LRTSIHSIEFGEDVVLTAWKSSDITVINKKTAVAQEEKCFNVKARFRLFRNKKLTERLQEPYDVRL